MFWKVVKRCAIPVRSRTAFLYNLLVKSRTAWLLVDMDLLSFKVHAELLIVYSCRTSFFNYFSWAAFWQLSQVPAYWVHFRRLELLQDVKRLCSWTCKIWTIKRSSLISFVSRSVDVALYRSFNKWYVLNVCVFAILGQGRQTYHVICIICKSLASSRSLSTFDRVSGSLFWKQALVLLSTNKRALYGTVEPIIVWGLLRKHVVCNRIPVRHSVHLEWYVSRTWGCVRENFLRRGNFTCRTGLVDCIRDILRYKGAFRLLDSTRHFWKSSLQSSCCLVLKVVSCCCLVKIFLRYGIYRG